MEKLGIWTWFFPPFPVSASQNLEPFLRSTGLQYCQCWRHLPFSAASLHHFVIKNSKSHWKVIVFHLVFPLTAGGPCLERSCHVSVIFWVVTCVVGWFFFVGNFKAALTLLHFVGAGHVRISNRIGICLRNMTVPWPDNSGASGVLQICSPHVLLSRRADSSDYARSPRASWSKGPKRDCCPIC